MELTKKMSSNRLSKVTVSDFVDGGPMSLVSRVVKLNSAQNDTCKRPYVCVRFFRAWVSSRTGNKRDSV